MEEEEKVEESLPKLMRIVLVRSEVISASDSDETILCVLVISQINMWEKDSFLESDFKEQESS